jgi:hypothetical protein
VFFNEISMMNAGWLMIRISSRVTPELSKQQTITPIARFPGLRAVAWSGETLYAARGYALLRAKVRESPKLVWERVGMFRPDWKQRITVRHRLTARLFRDGFHALAALPAGRIVAAVAGAIITLAPNESEFRMSHVIRRGTRPLHVTATPSGVVFWGEYFDNPAHDEVHIYASSDGGATWQIAYTFPKGAIRHIHNIVYDSWENCLWILTGDHGDECRILRATCDLGRVETVLQGNQQARAVALVPTADALYFSSDTPLEKNYIYRLDRKGNLSQLAPISSSSIYGCRVGDSILFSTMVEPSKVNPARHVRIYAGHSGSPEWRPILEWQKDGWPMSLFQYGNAFLPDGNNTTPYLAVTTTAVKSEDMFTTLYEVSR